MASTGKSRLARIASVGGRVSFARQGVVFSWTAVGRSRDCAPARTSGRPGSTDTWQWSPSSFAGTLALQHPSTPNKEGPHGQIHRNRRSQCKSYDCGGRCARQASGFARRGYQRPGDRGVSSCDPRAEGASRKGRRVAGHTRFWNRTLRWCRKHASSRGCPKNCVNGKFVVGS